MLLQEVRKREVVVKDGGDSITLTKDCDIIVVSDFHIAVKKKRPNYFWELMSYLDRIIRIMQSLSNPVFISLGDLHDKDFNGAKGLLYFEQVLKRFQQIERITKGRCYIVYGNHEDTYLDTTPTALLMSPSPYLRKVMESNGKDPKRSFGTILKTPHTLRIHDTKITLNHFNKRDKEYPTIEGDSEYHIALYHDTFLNHTMRNLMEGKLPVSKIWKNEMSDLNLNGTDLAIFGDFHIPVPLFRVNNRRNTAIVIPGSYGRNNFRTERHDSVKLPIIKIRKGKEPKILINTFPLYRYTLSYNVKEKIGSTLDITAEIRKMVGKMRGSGREEISLKKFSSYINEVYGEEWGLKVYKYIESIYKEDGYGEHN